MCIRDSRGAIESAQMPKVGESSDAKSQRIKRAREYAAGRLSVLKVRWFRLEVQGGMRRLQWQAKRRHAPAARAARPRPRLAGRIRPPRPAVGPLPP
eukprot:5286913-Pyramimonas_sp.AAC.3